MNLHPNTPFPSHFLGFKTSYFLTYYLWLFQSISSAKSIISPYYGFLINFTMIPLSIFSVTFRARPVKLLWLLISTPPKSYIKSSKSIPEVLAGEPWVTSLIYANGCICSIYYYCGYYYYSYILTSSIFF